MNLTLSIDKRPLEKARRAVGAMGLSLNEMIRRYLAKVAGEGNQADTFQEFREISTTRGGHSQGRQGLLAREDGRPFQIRPGLVHALHGRDLKAGFSEVYMPESVVVKSFPTRILCSKWPHGRAERRCPRIGPVISGRWFDKDCPVHG